MDIFDCLVIPAFVHPVFRVYIFPKGIDTINVDMMEPEYGIKCCIYYELRSNASRSALTGIVWISLGTEVSTNSVFHAARGHYHVAIAPQVIMHIVMNLLK
jgi:hypothetical protein